MCIVNAGVIDSGSYRAAAARWEDNFACPYPMLLDIMSVPRHLRTILPSICLFVHAGLISREVKLVVGACDKLNLLSTLATIAVILNPHVYWPN